MAEIEAYTKARMGEILDDTIQSLAIIGTTPNQILRATLQDGTTEDLGNVSGAQGPVGYTGAGIAGVVTLFNSVIPGDWHTIETTADWDEHASPDWAQLRYRITGDIVELNGWTKYVGASDVNQTSYITDLSGASTPIFPAEATPSSGYRILHAQRYGRYPATVVLGVLAPGFTLFSYQGLNQPALKDQEWISFTGCSYRLGG